MEDVRTDSETQALVAELAAHSAELSAMLDESLLALVDALAARPSGGEPRGAAASVLPPDVLEIATLQAQTAGIGVAEWLREAVLAHAALPTAALDGDGDRPRRARDDARRLRGETQALKGQTEQTTAQAKLVKAKVQRRRPPATGP
jgi:hypothetical protein